MFRWSVWTPNDKEDRDMCAAKRVRRSAPEESTELPVAGEEAPKVKKRRK